MPQLADFDYTDHGSIGLLIPISEDAKTWAQESIQASDYVDVRNCVYIEHRYVDDILRGALDAGLTIASGDLWIVQDSQGDLYGAWSLPQEVAS